MYKRHGQLHIEGYSYVGSDEDCSDRKSTYGNNNSPTNNLITWQSNKKNVSPDQG